MQVEEEGGQKDAGICQVLSLFLSSTFTPIVPCHGAAPALPCKTFKMEKEARKGFVILGLAPVFNITYQQGPDGLVRLALFFSSADIEQMD